MKSVLDSIFDTYKKEYLQKERYFAIEIKKAFERIRILEILYSHTEDEYKRVIHTDFFYAIMETMYEYLVVSTYRIANDQSEGFNLSNFKNEILKNMNDLDKSNFTKLFKENDFAGKISKIHNGVESLRNKAFAHNDEIIMVFTSENKKTTEVPPLISITEISGYVKELGSCFQLLTYGTDIGLEPDGYTDNTSDLQFILDAVKDKIMKKSFIIK